jgi:UDP-N-acetylglucosamine enolpyruvyl transferase
MLERGYVNLPGTLRALGAAVHRRVSHAR